MIWTIMVIAEAMLYLYDIKSYLYDIELYLYDIKPFLHFEKPKPFRTKLYIFKGADKKTILCE